VRWQSRHSTGARPSPGSDPDGHLNLPGISGIQALKILSKDPATAHIPVIALSANAMPRDIETKAWRAGFFRYLTQTHQDLMNL